MKNIAVISLFILLNACAIKQPEIIQKNRPTHWAKIIKADANLHQVDNLLYRSEQLIDDDKKTIEQLGIKTIINLRYFDRNDNEQLFKGQSIKLINNPILTFKAKPSDIAKALHAIKQEQKHGSVLLHCYHGADRTGIVTAMYRIIYQNWTIEDARQEMKNGGFGYHSVWKNLDNLLSQDGVNKVKAELEKLEHHQ